MATTTKRLKTLNGRAIAFPDVTTFGELFTECKAHDPKAPPVAQWKSWECGTWSDRAGRTRTVLSGYLAVRDDGYRSFTVKPSDAVIEWIGANTLHVPNDTKTFTVTVWDDGQALVCCEAGQIIANYYLAIIDAATIPASMDPPEPPRKKGTEKQETMRTERERYMNGEIDHQTYYLWLSDWIGLPDSLVPATLKELQASTDPHLNDIALSRWDRMHDSVRTYAAGLHWSMSDSVCCLKALARRKIERSKKQ